MVAESQSRNASLSIIVTLSGIVMDVKLSHPPKVPSWITVTPLGILKDVRLQLSKAKSPIEVTLSGIFIEVKFSQSSKALSPIEVTLLGIFMEDKLLQPLKIPFAIEVTLLGITMELKEEQSSKAYSHINLTGISIPSTRMLSGIHIFLDGD